MLHHVAWLKNTGKKLTSKDGKEIEVYELVVDSSDEATLSAWAKHFRVHYCSDGELDLLRSGMGLSREDLLLNFVFPDKRLGFGPATRAGDFAEILIADLLEGQLGYWAPRVRYSGKMIPNESSKGTDVFALKFAGGGPANPSSNDRLIAIEAKAKMSGKPANRLQEAVDDSKKDHFRIGLSLFAAKRRLLEQEKFEEAARIERFQEGVTIPYISECGAAAVICSRIYSDDLVTATDCSKHESAAALKLLVVHSNDFMQLIHELYERAAYEA